MREVQPWLSVREPAAPPPVMRGLEVDQIETLRSAAELPEVLARAGRARLDQARLNLGRVRESAFHLLAADALVTYACEAAVEAEDPGSALLAVLEVSACP